MEHNRDKLLIGSEEWFSFPALGIPAVKARIDSGAKTSSIHAVNITPFKRKGDPWVRFEVHPLQNDRRTLVRCEAPVVDRRTVKSSSGDSGRRYVIRTTLAMGERNWEVEVTLANRDSMGYRMLLGREAMIGRTLVDPGARFVHGDLSTSFLERTYASLKHSRGKGLNIGLLASDFSRYSLDRMVEAAEERGHKVRLLDVRHCYMKLDAVAPEVRYHGGYLLQDLDVLINYADASHAQYAYALSRQCENLDIIALNGSEGLRQSRDKLRAMQLLLEQGFNMPVSAVADAPVDTADLVDMVGGAPLVVSLLNGDRIPGSAIRAETREAAEAAINAFKAVRANLLVQELVKESQGRGLRGLVIDGRVVVAIECSMIPGDGDGDEPDATLIKLTSEEKKLMARAVAVLDLSVASVDLVRAHRGALLLQVDPTPDLQQFEAASNRNLAGDVIHAAEQKVGWKQQLAADS